jgi:hypothetical protein
MGNLTSWNPLGHSRPVTGLLYLYLYNPQNTTNFGSLSATIQKLISMALITVTSLDETDKF